MKYVKLYFLLVLLAFSSVFSSEKGTFSGILVDKMCASNMIKTPDQAFEKASKHTRFCALEDACLASGYGIVTKDGKYITFDSSGNKEAERFLRKSTAKNNLHVEVTGKLKNELLYVKKISAIK